MVAKRLSWQWAVLLLLTSTRVWAQPIFSVELGIAGASAQDLILLPNGDLISAGHRNAQLQLVRWTALGDTLWVIDYPIPIPLSAEERRLEVRLLTTGEVLVTTLFGSSLFDQEGVLLNSIDLRGIHVLELGVDSLLSCTSDSLFLKDRTGNLIWERAIVRPDMSDEWDARISSVPSGFITLTCQVAGEFQGPGGSLQLGRYSNAGDLIDTLTIASSNVPGELAGTFDLSRTADGGALGTAALSYTFRILRFNNEGDTLWTRSFSPFDPLGEGLQPFWPSGEIVELMNGDLLLSGHVSDNSGHSSRALAELDSAGNLLCLEEYGTLPGGSAAYRSAIAQGTDGIIYMLSGIESPVSAISAGLLAFNDQCVRTSLPETTGTSTCSTPRLVMRSGSIFVDRSPCEGRVRYRVYSSAGVVTAVGSAQGGTFNIDLGYSTSGLVVVKFDDGKTGTSAMVKLIIP